MWRTGVRVHRADLRRREQQDQWGEEDGRVTTELCFVPSCVNTCGRVDTTTLPRRSPTASGTSRRRGRHARRTGRMHRDDRRPQGPEPVDGGARRTCAPIRQGGDVQWSARTAETVVLGTAGVLLALAALTLDAGGRVLVG